MPVYQTTFAINASRSRQSPPGQVRVTHVEDVHGLLAPLFGLALGSRVQSSHDALNAALKARAEAAP